MVSADRRLIEDCLPIFIGEEPEYISHYTKLATLLEILGCGGITSLWATGVQYLNDRQELTYGLEKLELAASGHQLSPTLQQAFGQLRDAPDVYQVSFSGAVDELGQWRGYGANGNGCSVIVKRDDVYPLASFAGWVIYDHSAQDKFAEDVVNALRAFRGTADDLTIYLTMAAAFMKHPGFQPEIEYRMLIVPESADPPFTRVTIERLAPYVQALNAPRSVIPVHKILVGPGWQLAPLGREEFVRHHVPRGVRRLLDWKEISNVEVAPSQIPYDPR